MAVSVRLGSVIEVAAINRALAQEHAIYYKDGRDGVDCGDQPAGISGVPFLQSDQRITLDALGNTAPTPLLIKQAVETFLFHLFWFFFCGFLFYVRTRLRLFCVVYNI